MALRTVPMRTWALLLLVVVVVVLLVVLEALLAAGGATYPDDQAAGSMVAMAAVGGKTRALAARVSTAPIAALTTMSPEAAEAPAGSSLLVMVEVGL